MKPYIADNKKYLESKVMPVTETGCWVWLGGLTSEGYGQTQMRWITANLYIAPMTYKHTGWNFTSIGFPR